MTAQKKSAKEVRHRRAPPSHSEVTVRMTLWVQAEVPPRQSAFQWGGHVWTPAMAVLSRLRASATMGQQTPRITFSTYDGRDVFRQNLSQKSEGGVQDLMSCDLPCAQRVDLGLTSFLQGLEGEILCNLVGR